MASFFRSWLGSAPRIARSAPTSSTTLPLPTDSEDDGNRAETEADNDAPPAFPAADSAQRASATTTKKTKRSKIALAPGHSPLDWANLKASGEDLRGVECLMRIPPSVLKRHNKRDDAWSAFHGKVYNITHYIAFHPGGEKELLRVAGRDGTKLFTSTHAWVNADAMLEPCLVGFLVPEP
ncbi:cytochrome b5 [Cylindrobasidium torrendii FP15055 ss-10]|uniref:Cytochrome b5 n=1 Tax=Cylindrobasidium torrendii FP15055 ss-10 TaxID=1314674 RepID=A0A0D7B3T3_9AGAR|nr:cytochrome b5 [Cylindrobasidium torrendii FP15055 ss-10]